MKAGMLCRNLETLPQETTFFILQRRLKGKALILFGYSTAFCGHSSPRHHILEHLMVLFQLNTKMYLTRWRRLPTWQAIPSKISLGTCIIDMLFHNPVVLARRFATLDILSHGTGYCRSRNWMVKR